jgi:hypothetical protein
MRPSFGSRCERRASKGSLRTSSAPKPRRLILLPSSASAMRRSRGRQVRNGLSAGGRWIRTIGTPPIFLAARRSPRKSTFRNIIGSLATGTDGSNPSPSSRQSVSRRHPLSKVENPGFPRGCPRLAWRPGRERRAGCFDIAPTGGNISAGPYSSTAVPLMGLARMPRRSQRTRGSGLNVK